MGLLIVTGLLETLGESVKPRKSDARTYDYLSVRHADGTSTLVRKIHVPEDVDRILAVDQQVQLFVLRALWFYRVLLAARVGNRHAISALVTWSLARFYLTLLFGVGLMAGGLAVLGVIMMLTVIGIPIAFLLWALAVALLLASGYSGVRWPLWRAQTLSALRAEGLAQNTRRV